MFRGLFAFLAIIVPLLAAGSARSQTFQQEQGSVTTRAHAGALPFATLTEMWAFGRRWSVNGFYALRRGPPGPDQTPHWVIRSAWGNLGGEGGVRWTDSRTCPALASKLRELEGLGIARAEVPGLGLAVAPPPLDGASFIYRQRFGSDDGGAPVEFEARGNVTTQIGMWWVSTDRALADCWTEQEPAP